MLARAMIEMLMNSGRRRSFCCVASVMFSPASRFMRKVKVNERLWCFISTWGVFIAVFRLFLGCYEFALVLELLGIAVRHFQVAR